MIPSHPLTDGSVSELLQAGIVAPSGDNSQPWAFRWNHEGLWVELDTVRSDNFFEVDRVGALASIGAVVANVELAAAALGYRAAVVWCTKVEEGVVAHLTFEPIEPIPSTLAAAIPDRCVNRRPFDRQPLPAEWLAHQVEDAATSATTLTWLTEPGELARIRRVIQLADWVRYTHRLAHESLMAELRFTRAEAEATRDGMAIPVLEAGPFAGPFLKAVRPWPRMALLNRLGAFRGLTLPTTRLAASAPAIGLLSASTDTPLAFLNGGRAMERIWLAATAEEIRFQPMTVATLFIRRLLRHGPDAFDTRQRRWLEEAWRLLQGLFPVDEQSAMVLLFRVGHGPPARARSLRRPVESFLDRG